VLVLAAAVVAAVLIERRQSRTEMELELEAADVSR
jgi:hypothetical protein